LHNQDADVLGVWQDAKTLRKCPVFKAPNNVKRTGGSTTSPSMDKPDEDDIQVVKVVESHSDEISRSGNTSECCAFLFLCKLPFKLLTVL